MATRNPKRNNNPEPIKSFSSGVYCGFKGKRSSSIDDAKDLFFNFSGNQNKTDSQNGT